ncbi:MAG TPA: hypothetical protein VL133_05875 [Devosia sp.]|nr:hypothetical protein [Devosia sp.]
MGKLVKFDNRSRPASTTPHQTGNAQILMFTGVRYERGTPLLANSKRLDPSRPKHKRV